MSELPAILFQIVQSVLVVLAAPLVVLAGAEYGTGSSRDWAAKGTYLLGVKAVIAVSYERIHRSNLVGMGVLPLQFRDGENRDVLELDLWAPGLPLVPEPAKRS